MMTAEEGNAVTQLVRLFTAAALLMVFAVPLWAAGSAAVEPFENSTWSTPANAIDAHVIALLGRHGRGLRNPCSDAVFIRRVYLDMIGALPTPREVEAFLQDPAPGKRAALIEKLFSRDEFADYWAMKWSDLLRVKSEYPIKLWPNAVQAYHHWIREAIRTNQSYDKFARDLLTSSGSNFRVPPVNFYRAVQGRDPESIAKAVALTFMGVRIESWPETRRKQFAEIFSKVAYKSTREWKEEIVYLNPEATQPLKAVFPDGSTASIPGDADPRQSFARWLITPNNKWFARNIVNRIWAWTMGHGIIHEPDDIRPDNPPACPELLAYLEKELVKSNYDLRHIYRLILNSRTYQQSSIPHNDTAPELQFAHYVVRQLDAEVLMDALCWIGGQGETYSSPIPEPFTFIPKDQRTTALADASITSSFLATFGRPSRDTGLFSERNSQPSDTQRLYMLNSSDVQRRIELSPRLSAAVTSARRNAAAAVRGIYLVILSRYPTPAEMAVIGQYSQTKGMLPKQVVADLAWALINSKEFLCRH